MAGSRRCPAFGSLPSHSTVPKSPQPDCLTTPGPVSVASEPCPATVRPFAIAILRAGFRRASSDGPATDAAEPSRLPRTIPTDPSDRGSIAWTPPVRRYPGPSPPPGLGPRTQDTHAVPVRRSRRRRREIARSRCPDDLWAFRCTRCVGGPRSCASNDTAQPRLAGRTPSSVVDRRAWLHFMVD